jgi:uncharacterized metal-binding protein YceD (DUF177 family)
MPINQPPLAEELPPFSRPFDVDAQKEYPAFTDITANEEERAALAKMLAIPAIAELKARLKIAHAPGGRFIVSGEVEARVTRTCVVSLDPFEEKVHEPLDGFFEAPPIKGRRPAAQAKKEEVVVDPNDDTPDPLVDGCIDMGVLAAEFLALGLDPHPRKPGVVFELGPDANPPEASPFAVLERLKATKPPK